MTLPALPMIRHVFEIRQKNSRLGQSLEIRRQSRPSQILRVRIRGFRQIQHFKPFVTLLLHPIALILTLYGLDSDSRIADPMDASHIFTWLICETRDDKGNAVLYRYKAEDGLGVKLEQAHERNRGPHTDVRRAANRYLKRIHYGNRTPLLDNAGYRPRFLDKAQIDTEIANAAWMFEVVFDYADHDGTAPKPNDDGARDTAGLLNYPWKPRQDPFSSYRSGFEVRTMRLCLRVLMFHHFRAGLARV